MKRISIYLIAIFGFVMFLAGCTREADPTHTPPEAAITMTARSLPTRTFIPNTPPWNATATPAATPFSTLGVSQADLRGQDVRFWYIGLPSDEIGLMVDTFNSINTWGIRVTARAFAGYGELNETLGATQSQGEIPDLVTAYNYQAARWDASGRKLADLNIYLSDPIWGLSLQEQADFYPVFWWQDVDFLGAKRYGVPFQRDGLVLFYNVTWATELGFEKAPTNPLEFERQVCAAAQANNQDERADNNNTGGWIVSGDPSTLAAWLLAFDASLLDPNGRYTLDTPESATTLTFLKELGDQGCAWQSVYAHVNEEFADRKALLITATTGGLDDQLYAFRQHQNSDQWQAIPYPGVQGKPVVVVRGPALVVFQGDEASELAAWLFARWLISPENEARRIAARGGYPARVATLEQLKSYASANPQWRQAVDLVLYARSEPGNAPWMMVRWAMSDALTQLYQPNFSAAQIPSVLKLLDQLAIEASIQYR